MANVTFDGARTFKPTIGTDGKIQINVTQTPHIRAMGPDSVAAMNNILNDSGMDTRGFNARVKEAEMADNALSLTQPAGGSGPSPATPTNPFKPGR